LRLESRRALAPGRDGAMRAEERLPRAVSPVVDIGVRIIARQGGRAGGEPRYLLTLPKQLNHLWTELWEERREVRFLVEVLDYRREEGAGPGALPSVMSPVIDLGTRRVSRQGARSSRGSPRFTLVLPRSLDHVWEKLWSSRARVRVVAEVLGPKVVGGG